MEVLGHTIGTTANIYGHLSAETTKDQQTASVTQFVGPRDRVAVTTAVKQRRPAQGGVFESDVFRPRIGPARR